MPAATTKQVDEVVGRIVLRVHAYSTISHVVVRTSLGGVRDISVEGKRARRHHTHLAYLPRCSGGKLVNKDFRDAST